MKQNNRKVDIIVPIYNAYEELVKCVESIEKWTDLEENRLILINDKSSDERVGTFLNKIQKNNIIVKNNVENQGFSANINLGMEQSDENDVILLNSDTVVTKGWVEKLRKCAYSDITIATVTPLSNNATLCSVPDFLEENKLPEGYSLDEYAELIEKISLKRYPEIPVSHGFCMYVKREVIKKIGNFDAETFEKGYGEENDFCYRAIQAGYYHVMCDDTFILHTGTSSFMSEEKRKYIEEHEKIIDSRYPVENHNVRVHCRDNPNALVSENIRFWIGYNKREKRKTILYLVQSDFRPDAKDNVGGTQLHVKDLTMGLRHQYDILVAARNENDLNVTLYTEEEQFSFKYYIGEKGAYRQFRSKKIAELYGKILDNFSVDVVHVHHTIGLTLEMFYEASKREIPLFATIHDFYFVCPTTDLMSNENKLCIGNENNEEACRNCLKCRTGIATTVPYLDIWRKENSDALKLVQKIFTPSESAKRVFTSYFKELEEKVTVIEHGSDPMQCSSCIKEVGEKFNVAFLGGINVAKVYKNVT